MLKISPFFSPYNFSCQGTTYHAYAPKEHYEEIDLLDSIQTNNLEINFCFDKKNNRKLLNYSGENLYSFSHLVKCIPEGTDTKALAQALNYLINGIDSQVITDPIEFQKKYESLLGLDPTTTSHMIGNHSLNIYHQEHYDTSKIEAPKITEKVLEFYIEINHIPYKVTCEWPVKSDPPDIKQETLPPIEENLFT